MSAPLPPAAPTTIPPANFDFALQQLERVLSNQLNSIDGLSTKASITLGFALTVFGALFGLARETVTTHPAASFISAAIFGGSILLMALSLLVRDYHDAPHPSGLLRLLPMSPIDLKRQTVANLADAYIQNTVAIRRGFATLNGGLILFILGTFVFAFGVVLT